MSFIIQHFFTANTSKQASLAEVHESLVNNCNLDYFWNGKVKNVFVFKNQKLGGLALFCLAVFPVLSFNGGKKEEAFAHLSS